MRAACEKVARQEAIEKGFKCIVIRYVYERRVPLIYMEVGLTCPTGKKFTPPGTIVTLTPIEQSRFRPAVGC